MLFTVIAPPAANDMVATTSASAPKGACSLTGSSASRAGLNRTSPAVSS
jgi:hypothetical protein